MTRARWPLLLAVAIGTALLDQAAKAAALALLPPGLPQPLAGRWLYLTLQRNPGGLFGLWPQAGVYLTAAGALAAAVLLLYTRFALAHSMLLTVAVAMLLGGALGNLADRVRLGHVIDFIDLRFWPVFNIADIAISAGGALIVVACFLPHPQRERCAGPSPGRAQGS